MRDTDAVRKLRVEFAGEIRRRIAALATGITEVAVEPRYAVLHRVLRDAHTLKGSARTLALDGLAGAIEEVEERLGKPAGPDAAAAARALSSGAGAAEDDLSEADRLSQLRHDLRTPLNVVLGYGQLLQLSRLEEEERGYVDSIIRAAGEIAGLLDSTARAASSATPVDPPKASHAGGRSVLAIDDDEPSTRFLEKMLKQRPGIQLVAARSAADGLTALARHDIRLILLDLVLPDSDGASLLPRLREQAPAVPVVVVSGDIARASELRAAGASEVVSKPVTVERMLALIDAFVGGSSALDE